MEKAFTYMFKDNMFFRKAGICFLFYFVSQLCFALVSPDNKILTSVPNSILCGAVGLLTIMILSGYSFSIIKLIMDKKEDIVLPDINLAGNLVFGLKWILSIFSFTLAFMAVYIFFIFLNASIKMPLVVVLSVILLLVAMLAFMVILPALIAIFAKTEKISSIFRFGQAKELIAKNPGNYFAGVGFFLLLGVLFFVVISFCVFPVMFIFGKNTLYLLAYTSVIYSLISTYALFVTSYLYAKMVNSDLIEVETKEL